MEKLLNVDDKNIVRMVGIWGTGGIGKTTITKAVYNLISHKFESRCFLANVRSKSANQEGLAQLQETLLQDLLREKNLKVNDVSNGVNVIKRRLAQKKVLLILDDVSDLEQLNYLARESNWFGWGSRIVITTRDKHLLNAHQVRSVYEVRMLDDAAALELFSLNAFKRNQPPNNYLKLARLAIFYAQGLPLALIVLGSHLIDRSIEQWEVALDSSKRVPHKKIQDILRVSFDALEDHLKTLFLDIACFFNGNTVNHVIPILEACDLNPVIGIELLTEFPKIIGKMASLRYLDLSGSGVKELDPSIGKLIGLKELYLEKCANLRTLPCSIYGLQNVEILDLSGCSKLATFPAKTNIFQDNDVSLSLPKLEVFRIGGSSLLDVDFLTTLDCWETLTELDLSYNYFSNLPSCISKFVNLWRLELDCCRSLREIPELPPNLVEINLSDCISLERYAKSSKMLEHKETEGIRRINLWNCHLGLSMEKMKRILLNNQEKSPFGVVFPGSEVPNWFSKVELNDTDQLSIRIPENLKWENTGLAICAVSEEGGLNYFGADIFIGDIRIGRCRPWTFSRPSLRSTSDHVWVQYIPLPVKMKAKMKRKYWWQPYECRIQFDLALFNFTVKSYGVHLVTPGNETSMLSWLQKRSYYETL